MSRLRYMIGIRERTRSTQFDTLLPNVGTCMAAESPTLIVGMQAVSIVFFTETWQPDSFYDKILANRRMGLHTLCLLDIKVNS